MNFKLLCLCILVLIGLTFAQKGNKGRNRIGTKFPAFNVRPAVKETQIPTRPPPPVGIERIKTQVLLRTPVGFEERGGLAALPT